MEKAEIENTIRTGISVQMSAGVATAGTGFSSNEDKSPVTTSFKSSEETANEPSVILLKTGCDATEELSAGYSITDGLNTADSDNVKYEAAETAGDDLTSLRERSPKETIPDGLAPHRDKSPPIAQNNDHSNETNIQSFENQEINSSENTNSFMASTNQLSLTVPVAKDVETSMREGSPKATIPDSIALHDDKSPVAQNNVNVNETNIQSSENPEKNTSEKTDSFKASTSQMDSVVPVADDNSSANNIQSFDNQEIINTAEKKNSAPTTDSQSPSLPKKPKRNLRHRQLSNAKQFLRRFAKTGSDGASERTTNRVKWANSIIAKYKDNETGGGGGAFKSMEEQSIEETIPDGFAPHGDKLPVAQDNQHSSESNIQSFEKQEINTSNQINPSMASSNQLSSVVLVAQNYDRSSPSKDAETGDDFPSIMDRSPKETIPDGLAPHAEKPPMPQNNETNIHTPDHQETINTAAKNGSASTTDTQPLSLSKKSRRELRNAKKILKKFVEAGDVVLGDSERIASSVAWAKSIIAKHTNVETVDDFKSIGEGSLETTLPDGFAPHGDKLPVGQNNDKSSTSKNAKTGDDFTSMRDQSHKKTIPDRLAPHAEKPPVAQNNETNIHTPDHDKTINTAEKNGSASTTGTQPLRRDLRNAKRILKKFVELGEVAFGNSEGTAKVAWAKSYLLKHENVETGDETNIQSPTNQEIINTAAKNRSANTTDIQPLSLPNNRGDTQRSRELRNAKIVLGTFVETGNDSVDSKLAAERVKWANSIIAKYKDVETGGGDDLTSLRKRPVKAIIPDGLATTTKKNRSASSTSGQPPSHSKKINIYQRAQELRNARRVLMMFAETGKDTGVEWANSIFEKYNDEETHNSCDTKTPSTENQVKNTPNHINPFKASTSQLSLVGDEDTLNGPTNFKHMKRTERYHLMKDKFKELGFTINEIRLMKVAMDEQRWNYQNNVKIKRICEETKMDPESAQKSWLERKERELVGYRAEKDAKIASGTFNPIPFRERKQMKRKRCSTPEPSSDNFNTPDILEQYKDVNPLKRPPIFMTPAMLTGVQEKISSFNCKGKRLKRSSNSYKYKVTLPNHSMTSDEFLKIIKKQNGLPTESWTLTCKKPWNNMFKAWYLVDQDSYDQLKKSSNRVYFMFEKVKLKFCEDN